MTDDAPDSPARLHARLRTAHETRTAQGRNRELRPPQPVRLNFADNDYLGLAQDPAVKNAVRAALDAGPVSASSSPLVRGYQAPHVQLESRLCAWHGFASGLVWNSGFTANQSVLGTLATAGDLILADRLVHHSLLAGAMKSGAKLRRFAHNDLATLEQLLAKTNSGDGVRWVVTESVYSMDGDGPDLARLAALKAKHRFVWLLDEAHALGWYGAHGQGRAAETDVVESVDVLVGTLGKALGGMGAYTLFHDATLRDALINRAGEFIYSTFLSPLLAAAAIAAIERARALAPQAPAWRAQARRLREALRARGWTTSDGDAPIVPVVIGTDASVVALGQHLLAQGIAVGTIRPPTVPEGTARLRLSLKAGTTWEELEELMREMDAWRDAQGKRLGVRD